MKFLISFIPLASTQYNNNYGGSYTEPSWKSSYPNCPTHDDNQCLRNIWVQNIDYTCGGYSDYCNGDFQDVMRYCCPDTCSCLSAQQVVDNDCCINSLWTNKHYTCTTAGAYWPFDGDLSPYKDDLKKCCPKTFDCYNSNGQACDGSGGSGGSGGNTSACLNNTGYNNDSCLAGCWGNSDWKCSDYNFEQYCQGQFSQVTQLCCPQTCTGGGGGACTYDYQCPNGQYCWTANKQCVGCLNNTHCANGDTCNMSTYECETEGCVDMFHCPQILNEAGACQGEHLTVYLCKKSCNTCDQNLWSCKNERADCMMYPGWCDVGGANGAPNQGVREVWRKKCQLLCDTCEAPKPCDNLKCGDSCTKDGNNGKCDSENECITNNITHINDEYCAGCSKDSDCQADEWCVTVNNVASCRTKCSNPCTASTEPAENADCGGFEVCIAANTESGVAAKVCVPICSPNLGQDGIDLHWGRGNCRGHPYQGHQIAFLTCFQPKNIKKIKIQYPDVDIMSARFEDDGYPMPHYFSKKVCEDAAHDYCTNLPEKTSSYHECKNLSKANCITKSTMCHWSSEPQSCKCDFGTPHEGNCSMDARQKCKSCDNDELIKMRFDNDEIRCVYPIQAVSSSGKCKLEISEESLWPENLLPATIFNSDTISLYNGLAGFPQETLHSGKTLYWDDGNMYDMRRRMKKQVLDLDCEGEQCVHGRCVDMDMFHQHDSNGVLICKCFLDPRLTSPRGSRACSENGDTMDLPVQYITCEDDYVPAFFPVGPSSFHKDSVQEGFQVWQSTEFCEDDHFLIKKKTSKDIKCVESVETLFECKEAFEIYGDVFQTSDSFNTDGIELIKDEEKPKGCFVDQYGRGFFNKHATGDHDKMIDSFLICKQGNNRNVGEKCANVANCREHLGCENGECDWLPNSKDLLSDCKQDDVVVNGSCRCAFDNNLVDEVCNDGEMCKYNGCLQLPICPISSSNSIHEDCYCTDIGQAIKFETVTDYKDAQFCVAPSKCEAEVSNSHIDTGAKCEVIGTGSDQKCNCEHCFIVGSGSSAVCYPRMISIKGRWTSKITSAVWEVATATAGDQSGSEFFGPWIENTGEAANMSADTATLYTNGKFFDYTLCPKFYDGHKPGFQDCKFGRFNIDGTVLAERRHIFRAECSILCDYLVWNGGARNGLIKDWECNFTHNETTTDDLDKGDCRIVASCREGASFMETANVRQHHATGSTLLDPAVDGTTGHNLILTGDDSSNGASFNFDGTFLRCTCGLIAPAKTGGAEVASAEDDHAWPGPNDQPTYLGSCYCMVQSTTVSYQLPVFASDTPATLPNFCAGLSLLDDPDEVKGVIAATGQNLCKLCVLYAQVYDTDDPYHCHVYEHTCVGDCYSLQLDEHDPWENCPENVQALDDIAAKNVVPDDQIWHGPATTFKSFATGGVAGQAEPIIPGYNGLDTSGSNSR